jgi:hypothetical protein
VVQLRGKEERTLQVAFFVLGGYLGMWGGIRNHIVYLKIKDTFPEQFDDELFSRFAFGVYAISRSTPLPLQTEYMKSMGWGCVSFLSMSLGFFISGNIPFGCLCLLASLAIASSIMKDWKAYKENCSRAESQQTKE